MKNSEEGIAYVCLKFYVKTRLYSLVHVCRCKCICFVSYFLFCQKFAANRRIKTSDSENIARCDFYFEKSTKLSVHRFLHMSK